MAFCMRKGPRAPPRLLLHYQHHSVRGFVTGPYRLCGIGPPVRLRSSPTASHQVHFSGRAALTPSSRSLCRYFLTFCRRLWTFRFWGSCRNVAREVAHSHLQLIPPPYVKSAPPPPSSENLHPLAFKKRHSFRGPGICARLVIQATAMNV